MTNARVQISVSLLEKLAGIRKEPPQRKQQPAPQGFPLHFGLPVLQQRPPAAAQQHEADNLQQSIQHSRRVGELLLKSEEQEAAAVRQRADEMLKQYSTKLRPAACSAEQQACVDCYRQHPGDVLRCAQLVETYTTCAQQAAGQLMT